MIPSRITLETHAQSLRTTLRLLSEDVRADQLVGTEKELLIAAYIHQLSRLDERGITIQREEDAVAYSLARLPDHSHRLNAVAFKSEKSLINGLLVFIEKELIYEIETDLNPRILTTTPRTFGHLVTVEEDAKDQWVATLNSVQLKDLIRYAIDQVNEPVLREILSSCIDHSKAMLKSTQPEGHEMNSPSRINQRTSQSPFDATQPQSPPAAQSTRANVWPADDPESTTEYPSSITHIPRSSGSAKKLLGRCGGKMSSHTNVRVKQEERSSSID